MKKSLLALPVLGLGVLALASCQSTTGDDLTKGRSDLAYFADDTTGILEHYNATFTDTTGSVLLSTVSKKAKEEATKKTKYLGTSSPVDTSTDETLTTTEEVTTTEDGDSWYKIFIATDYESSLIKREITSIPVNSSDNMISINEAFKDYRDNLKYFNVSNLTLTDLIYSSETSSILSCLYSSDEGIGNLTLGEFETDTTESWVKSVQFDNAKEYYDKHNDAEFKLEVVYLPTLVVRKYNNMIVLRSYLYVPVYSTITVGGKELVKNDDTVELENSSVAEVKTVEFNFNSNGLLNVKSDAPIEETTTTTDNSSEVGNTNNNSTKVFWIILGVILGVAAVGGVIVFFVFRKKN